MDNRPLSGVKVIELATFIAAPTCSRFLADQGADVIKIETTGGDPVRFAPLAEGRPVLRNENITFDLENGNKRGMAMNLKNPKCFEALMKLLETADVFVTNWRPNALARMGLEYEQLKAKFPKLVYASVTGYGDVGPDKDLPGYDYTAFWARSGILGSLYDLEGKPANLIPSMGDHTTGMFLAAGVCAALFNAARTGKGEKVSCSLLASAIFTQGTLLQTAQYEMLKYPMLKRNSPNPFNCCYQTKDGRWIQQSMPVFAMFPKFAEAMELTALLEDERFKSESAIASGGHGPALYDAISAAYAKFTVAEVSERLTKADIPFALAQVWSEVLQDEQAWADDVFTKLTYPSGERIAIRGPVKFGDAGLPEYKLSPHVGQHTGEILKELGYSDAEIQELLDAKEIRITTESYVN
ncbi:MAG: CoA transferase [Oscillospiraceae bacterium]|jgi:cinnamoyl-CoA:phenyllactate CoA-transferase|nr:CoA transferase [Oscillospiraceae bacterium]